MAPIAAALRSTPTAGAGATPRIVESTHLPIKPMTIEEAATTGACRRRSRQAGFALIEMLISFVLLMLAVTLAAQLLVEAAQMFTDVAGEQRDSMVPLALSRIRNDVQGSVAFQNFSLDPLACGPLVLSGGPNGVVVYALQGGDLRRSIVAPDGTIGAGDPLIRQVTAWTCQSHGSFPPVLEIDFTYGRRSVRRTPLPVLPAYAKPNSETRSESLFLALRGGGMGSSW